MALALVVVGWLIHFIHHISQSISVNHIVDRIARETELVIKELILHLRGRFQSPARSEPSPEEEARFLIVSPVISAMNGTASLFVSPMRREWNEIECSTGTHLRMPQRTAFCGGFFPPGCASNSSAEQGYTHVASVANCGRAGKQYDVALVDLAAPHFQKP
jgi:hypothetical protein